MGGLADCFYCMELLLVGRRFLYHTESSETGNVKGKKKKRKKERRSHEHLGSKVWQDVATGTWLGLCILNRGKMKIGKVKQ